MDIKKVKFYIYLCLSIASCYSVIKIAIFAINNPMVKDSFVYKEMEFYFLLSVFTSFLLYALYDILGE